jgi:hypothetical protein
MKFKLFFALLFITGGALSAAAQDRDARDKQELSVKNYQDIHVEVINYEGTPPTAADYPKLGLSTEELQTKIELRLRQANIRPQKTSPGMPTLKIFVMVYTAVYDIRLEFLQDTWWMTPMGWVHEMRPTWESNEAIGTRGNERAHLEAHLDRPQVLSTIDTLMDQFLNAYLKANQ